VKSWKTLWIILAALTFALFLQRAWVIPGTDAEAYYHAGIRAWHALTHAGDSALYRPEHTPFKYLPAVAYLFIPIGFLSFQWAKVALFLISWTIGFFLYRGAIARFGHVPALLAFIAFIRFHNHDFLNLQINHWILLCFCVFLLTRRTRPWLSASAFSWMALFKVTPLILLAPLVAFRSWKELARIGVILAVLLVFPALLAPEGFGIYRDWYLHVKATTPWPAPGFPTAQSVQGGLWFWLRGIVDPRVFLGVVSLLECALLLPIFLGSWGASEESEPVALVAASVLAVIFSPLAWKHLYLLLWPAFLVTYLRGRKRSAIAALLLMGVLPGIVAIFSKHWADRSYITVIGALVLDISLTILLWKSRAKLNHRARDFLERQAF
jgi:hypothetical protein